MKEEHVHNLSQFAVSDCILQKKTNIEHHCIHIYGVRYYEENWPCSYKYQKNQNDQFFEVKKSYQRFSTYHDIVDVIL